MTGSGVGQVALVTGGSRGVGRGIAIGLAEAGWTVHVSGRDVDRLDNTVERLVAVGGQGHAWVCDHSDDEQVEALVADVHGHGGRIDLLVNNAWAGPRMNHQRPEKFWERPISDWDQLIGIGLRAHVVATRVAIPLMLEQERALVVNISSVGTRAYLHSTLYGISKAGLDKFTHDAATELVGTEVTVVSLWTGLVRTDQLLDSGVEEIAGVRVADAETPELQGRVLAAVAADPAVGDYAGQVLITAETAARYGIVEVDGGVPVSPRQLFGGGPVFPPLR